MKILLLLFSLLCAGCTYTGALNHQFYNSKTDVPSKINAHVRYQVQQNQVCLNESRHNMNLGDCFVDVTEGMNDAIETLINDCFQPITSAATKYHMKVGVVCDVDWAYDLTTTIYLDFYDGASGQYIKRYSKTEVTSLGMQPIPEILIAGTYLCLFVPAPITLPLAAKLYGEQRISLIEASLTSMMTDLSYDLYLDRYLFERNTYNPSSKPVTKKSSKGSGFFISKNGYQLTDFDLVEHADRIAICHESKLYEACLINFSRPKNLALLKCDGNFPYLPIQDDGSDIYEFLKSVGEPELIEPHNKYDAENLDSAKHASAEVFCQ